MVISTASIRTPKIKMYLYGGEPKQYTYMSENETRRAAADNIYNIILNGCKRVNYCPLDILTLPDCILPDTHVLRVVRNAERINNICIVQLNRFEGVVGGSDTRINAPVCGLCPSLFNIFIKYMR